MGSKARILVTQKCLRKCVYCCNRYGRLMAAAKRIERITDVPECDEYLITGGEPLLEPSRTREVILQLRQHDPGKTIFLYSAWYTDMLESILPEIDGLHFTLHADCSNQDRMNLLELQALLMRFPGKSYRLYIHPGITKPVAVLPYLWKRVEVKPWLSEEECVLPAGENLFVLEDRTPSNIDGQT